MDGAIDITRTGPPTHNPGNHKNEETFTAFRTAEEFPSLNLKLTAGTRLVVWARPSLKAGFDLGFITINRPKKSVGGWNGVNAKRPP